MLNVQWVALAPELGLVAAIKSLKARKQVDSAEFIAGDCFQYSLVPRAFASHVLEGKVLGTRFTCFIHAHTAEKLSSTPFPPELRKEEKIMYLVSLTDLLFRRSGRDFNLPPGHTQGI